MPDCEWRARLGKVCGKMITHVNHIVCVCLSVIEFIKVSVNTKTHLSISFSVPPHPGVITISIHKKHLSSSAPLRYMVIMFFFYSRSIAITFIASFLSVVNLIVTYIHADIIYLFNI